MLCARLADARVGERVRLNTSLWKGCTPGGDPLEAGDTAGGDLDVALTA